MNPHYNPYADLNSPHSPGSDNYPPLSHHNGHSTLSQMDGHHQSFHHMNNNNGTPKHCAGCGGKILERFFLHALDRYWHNSCLKCSCCGATLGDIGTSCFTRSGMILCKADYSRLFGNSGACSACGQTIPANEFVMRTTTNINNNNNPQANNQNIQHFVFHLKCFSCSKCGSHLVQGDRYYMLAGSLVCEQDWHKLVKTAAPNPTPPLRKGKVGRPRRSRD